MSMGGADAAYAQDALGSMGANPAALATLGKSEVDLGLLGGITSGRFEKGSIQGHLNESFQALPEAAFALPVNDKVALGLSFVPESLLLADWRYPDVPGGLDGKTTYGQQEHRSELVVLRSALGAAVKLHPTFQLGASVGLLYNENRLVTPFIFQNLQPASAAAVNGAKTLLDLETSGFGWNVQLGALYAPVTNLQFAVTYKTESEISTDGQASGDPYAQFGVPPGPLAFHYDANVRNVFPQEVSAGASWKFHPQWRLALQVDWIDWSDAFQTLPVRLDHGSNPAVNGVLGASFQDNVPLNWRDRFVYRAGIEYAIVPNVFLRAGYAYGQSPAPDATLTPLTAVIMEHMVSAGFGYDTKSWGADLAWQYDLPASRHVGVSGLRSGEYSNSTVDVSVHRIALTAHYRF